MHRVSQLGCTLRINIPQYERRQVANYEIAGNGLLYNHLFALLQHYGLLLEADLALRLRNLATEVGTIDDTAMTIGIHAVHRIPVEYEGSTRLHCALDDEAQHIFDGNGAFGQSAVLQALLVAARPLIAPIVFEGIPLDRKHLVRAEHVPRAIGVFFQLLPKEIRNTNTGEYIMCLHAVIPIIGTNLKELGHISMPYIKVEGNRALTHAQLIHCNGGIIGELDPLEHSACHTLKATYIAPYGTHFTKVNTHATSVLRDLGKVVYRTIDTDKVIRHHINKTT